MVDTIYFGGGTPSLLTGREVARVVGAVRDAFDVDGDSEITLEANPESVTSASLESYRGGVNRLSFGVQSFRDEELRRLGRLHTARAASDALPLARAAGFDNVSFDLMMWLPQQSLSDWLTSVDALIEAGPEHASLYLLECSQRPASRRHGPGWLVAGARRGCRGHARRSAGTARRSGL